MINSNFLNPDFWTKFSQTKISGFEFYKEIGFSPAIISFEFIIKIPKLLCIAQVTYGSIEPRLKSSWILAYKSQMPAFIFPEP